MARILRKIRVSYCSSSFDHGGEATQIHPILQLRRVGVSSSPKRPQLLVQTCNGYVPSVPPLFVPPLFQSLLSTSN